MRDRRRRDDERAAAFAGVGRALRNLAVHQPAARGDALADAFPSLEFLPVADRPVFIDEFTPWSPRPPI